MTNLDSLMFPDRQADTSSQTSDPEVKWKVLHGDKPDCLGANILSWNEVK
jgi:hypothetical protein